MGRNEGDMMMNKLKYLWNSLFGFYIQCMEIYWDKKNPVYCIRQLGHFGKCETNDGRQF